MTSLLANAFRLRQRGELREGNWADIVVFDRNKVNDPATNNDPHHYAVDIPYVLVNGALVIKTASRPMQDRDRFCGTVPGRRTRFDQHGFVLAPLVSLPESLVRHSLTPWSKRSRKLATRKDCGWMQPEWTWRT